MQTNQRARNIKLTLEVIVGLHSELKIEKKNVIKMCMWVIEFEKLSQRLNSTFLNGFLHPADDIFLVSLIKIFPKMLVLAFDKHVKLPSWIALFWKIFVYYVIIEWNICRFFLFLEHTKISIIGFLWDFPSLSPDLHNGNVFILNFENSATSNFWRYQTCQKNNYL